MPRRNLALLLAVVCVVVLGVVAGKGTGDETDAQERALARATKRHLTSRGLAPGYASLTRLRQILDAPNVANDYIIDYMNWVASAYLSPPPPAGSPLDFWECPVYEVGLRAYAAKHGWPDEYLDEVREYRRSAERLFLQALTLVQIDRKTDTNTRDAVNIRAAQLLAETGNPDLSDNIIEALEKTIFKAKYGVSQRLYDEACAALGRLGNQDALAWMVEEFTHGRKSPRSVVDPLNAAHKAMILFDRELVDGRLRHRLVRKMIMAYAPMESMAHDMSFFWDRIGPDAIRATQYFAGDPKGDDGQPLGTMHELVEWFRAHKDPSKPPWTNG